MQYSTDSRWLGPVVLLLLLILTGVLFSSAPGTSDTVIWARYMNLASANGPLQGYALSQPDYPPFTIVLLTPIVTIAEWMSAPPLTTLRWALYAFLILTALSSWILTKRAGIACGIVAALALESVSHLYLDIFVAPFFVLSLLALRTERIALFSVLYTASFLIKWQPVVVAPFLLVYLMDVQNFAGLRNLPWRHRIFPAVLPSLAMILASLWLFGEVMIESLSRATSHEALSGFALNANWMYGQLLTHWGGDGFELHRIVDSRINDYSRYFTSVDPKVVLPPKLLFVASYLACLLAFFRRKKSYESLLLYSLYGFVGYYIFNTGVHENHLFIPAILGVLLLEFGRRRIFSGLYWAFALNLNLFVFYGWDGREIDYLSLPVTLLIAGVNSAAYLVALSGVLREGGSGSTRSSSRSTPS